ncbi:hypothetical protein PLUTE_b6001 [Pseudoalteromonas luteoviolacea DSM 6061]|nr:hypothetical protein [Pseudoalteromonas luteoviolacea DSM 6061]
MNQIIHQRKHIPDGSHPEKASMLSRSNLAKLCALP